jgi:hypothetical protein
MLTGFSTQTGLCVYEIDDPSIRSVVHSSFKLVDPHLTTLLAPDNRDDPNLDENTRFRNRIAELESLVRELRGKSTSSPL